MEFYTSPSFFILLAIAVVPAAVLGFMGKRIRLYGFVASWFFLLLLFAKDLPGALAFAGFVVVASAATFWTLKSWQEGEKSLVKYRVSLVVVLIPLVVYKIGAVFDQNLLGFIGISYLTFKAVQVLIEIRDGLIEEMSLFDYLYFLTFFAVITSGPIDRSRRFVEDAHRRFTRSEYADMLSRGILLLLIGAVYLLVLASISETFYTPMPFKADATLAHNLAAAVKDAYAYGLYLFFDFAGYSMMAMGASYCFGIRTPRNFRAPFASLDIKDFWNRWNMTLSFWLRDYVFMRFTMFATKRKLFNTRLQTACCGYIIDMVLMGAWHGLTVDYLAYGLYHGVLLAATDAYQKKSKFYKKHKNEVWFKLCSWAVTINLIMLGFALFSGQIHTIVGGFIHG